MSVLVTGANGFVGRHLIAALTDADRQPVGVDRSNGVDVLDEAGLDACLDAARPTQLIHLAGDADVGGSWNHPRSTFETNALGTLNVIESARRIGVGRMVIVSSADVYGSVTPDELPLTEMSPVRPHSPYAASKVAAEVIAMQQQRSWDLDLVVVRPFNHIGPGQSTRFVAPSIALQIARAEQIELSGTGDAPHPIPVGNLDARRDLTDVRDVVAAYLTLLDHGTPGTVYNVCSGSTTRIGDLADMLIARSSVPVELVIDPTRVRPVDLPVLCGSAQRLTDATGWAPRIPLTTSLDDILDDARSRVATTQD